MAKQNTKTPNAEAQALIVCDMLNDFVKKGAPLEVPAARTVIRDVKKEIQRARKNRIPVIYCCDAHKNNDPEFALWPRHAVEGTEGARVIKQLEPQEGDYVVTKTRYAGFYKTSLDTLLKRLGVNRLIITGVATNICILYTAADAYMRGYKVTIPRRCVAALTKREHQFSLLQMKRVFHAEIV